MRRGLERQREIDWQNDFFAFGYFDIAIIIPNLLQRCSFCLKFIICYDGSCSHSCSTFGLFALPKLHLAFTQTFTTDTTQFLRSIFGQWVAFWVFAVRFWNAVVFMSKAAKKIKDLRGNSTNYANILYGSPTNACLLCSL